MSTNKKFSQIKEDEIIKLYTVDNKTQEEIDKQAPVPKGDNSDLTTFNYVKWMHIACWSLFLVLPIMLDTVAFLVEICFIPINSASSRAGGLFRNRQRFL